MTTQPEALRLLQHINDLFVSQWGMNSPMAKDSKIVLDELRRLHEVEKQRDELLEALKSALWRLEQYNYQAMERTIEEARAAIALAERTTT